MDGPQFDAWTRRVMSGVQGRRAALKTGLAAAAAGVLGVRGSDEAAAAPRCPNRTGCNERCTNTNRRCSCIRRADGGRTCVQQCCSDRRCNRDRDCRNFEVCMETNCCRQRGSFCVPKCDARRPAYCDRQSGVAAQEAETSNAWAASTPE